MKITIFYKEYTDSIAEKIELECRPGKYLMALLEDNLLPSTYTFPNDSLITYNGKHYFAQTLNASKVKELVDETSPHPLYVTRYPNQKAPEEKEAPTTTAKVKLPDVDSCLMPLGNEYNFDEKTSPPALIAKVKKSPLFRQDALIREISPVRFHPDDPALKINANFIGETHYIAAEGHDAASFTRFAEEALFRKDDYAVRFIGRIGILGEDFWDCTRHAWVKTSKVISKSPVVITECTLEHPITHTTTTFTLYDFPYRETEPAPKEYLPSFMDLYKKSETSIVLWQCRSGTRRTADQILRSLMLDYRAHVKQDQDITTLVDFIRMHRYTRLFSWQISDAYDFLAQAIAYEATLSPLQVKSRTKLPVSFEEIQATVNNAHSDPKYREFISTEDSFFPFKIVKLEGHKSVQKSSTTEVIPATATPSTHAPINSLEDLNALLFPPHLLGATPGFAGSSNSYIRMDDLIKLSTHAPLPSSTSMFSFPAFNFFGSSGSNTLSSAPQPASAPAPTTTPSSTTSTTSMFSFPAFNFFGSSGSSAPSSVQYAPLPFLPPFDFFGNTGNSAPQPASAPAPAVAAPNSTPMAEDKEDKDDENEDATPPEAPSFM